MSVYPVHLRGAGVILREFRGDDAGAAFAVIGDDRVTRWLSFDSHRSPEQTASMLASAIERAGRTPRTEWYLAVTMPTGDLIGFVRLALNGVQAGKLGYAIHADHQGRGHATDAARTLTDFGFRQLGLHRISAAIGPDNAASIAVVQRLGFQPEGRIRDHVFTNGAWRDSLLHSVLADEWALAVAS